MPALSPATSCPRYGLDLQSDACRCHALTKSCLLSTAQTGQQSSELCCGSMFCSAGIEQSYATRCCSLLRELCHTDATVQCCSVHAHCAAHVLQIASLEPPPRYKVPSMHCAAEPATLPGLWTCSIRDKNVDAAEELGP